MTTFTTSFNTYDLTPHEADDIRQRRKAISDQIATLEAEKAKTSNNRPLNREIRKLKREDEVIQESYNAMPPFPLDNATAVRAIWDEAITPWYKAYDKAKAFFDKRYAESEGKFWMAENLSHAVEVLAEVEPIIQRLEPLVRHWQELSDEDRTAAYLMEILTNEKDSLQGYITDSSDFEHRSTSMMHNLLSQSKFVGLRKLHRDWAQRRWHWFTRHLEGTEVYQWMQDNPKE